MNLRSGVFFKDKPNGHLARLTQKNGEKTQINKIRNEEETLQLIPQKYKGSWEYCEQLYVNKLDNLEEVDKLLET